VRSLLLAALLPLILFADAHILVFHRFGDARHSATNTAIAVLKAEFDYLKTHGYEVIPLSRLAKALKNGEAVDDKWVVLTIDDSYKSFYDNGLPVFRAYGFPFTLFVYVEATDEGYGDFMSWEQVREAAKYGEIGLHGYGHRHETRLSISDLKEDTARGLRLFSKELHAVPRYYAYPYGEYDADVKTTIAADGFELILNQNSGAVTARSDPLDLDRIAVTGGDKIAQKLGIERLDAEWISPKRWPEGGRLKEIHAKIAPRYKTAELYVTGHGWRRVAVNDGKIDVKVDLPLGSERTRLFLKVGRKQNGIILVKE
jgi:poly-beta-1,6-N-acetyl-D-glucosamine N-deacetylase